jgi:hypothetical protein
MSIGVDVLKYRLCLGTLIGLEFGTTLLVLSILFLIKLVGPLFNFRRELE